MQVKKRKHFLLNLFCIYFCILFMFFFCIFVFCFSISLPYLLHRLPLILLLFLISKFLLFRFFSLTSFLLIHLRVSNSHFATIVADICAGNVQQNRIKTIKFYIIILCHPNCHKDRSFPLKASLNT
jgi:hypothetical protein